jgi:hypothetical protein
LRIKGDDTPIAPGEFRDVDIGSGALRDNILPLPYKEPSQVLFTLMSTIVEEGRRFAATADMKVSDMSAQAPVGTTLALLERQLKVMTAVQARLHCSFKQELQLLAGLIRDYTDDDYDYEPEDAPRKAKESDYNHVDIIPVSDPNAATMSQRVVQYQAVIQMAQMAPDIYDMPQLHRRMLEVLGIKNPDKLIPLPEDQKPRDPVTENMNVLKLEPVKAFMFQDHESHIQVHMAMVQDPTIQQLIGQNPKAQQIGAALMAHIAEHVGFAYRHQVEQQLGTALPKIDEDLPPQAEYALANLVAQAANQVLQQNQAKAAQQQAQQQAQDPVLQMQQAELQLRQQEVQIKAQEAQMKAQIAQQELQLKSTEMQNKMELEGMRIGAQIQESKTKLAADKERREEDQEREGVRIGVDMAKHKAEKALQAQTAALQFAENRQRGNRPK